MAVAVFILVCLPSLSKIPETYGWSMKLHLSLLESKLSFFLI